MSPDRLESLGLILVVLGAATAVAATWALAGWPWSLVTLSALTITAGVLLVRTAALTPPKPADPPKEDETE